MISARMNRCVIVLVLALWCSAGWAGEPNEMPIHLEFEVSPAALKPPGYPTHPETAGPLFSSKPPYAAAIALVPPTEYLPLPSPSPGLWEAFLGDNRLPGRGYVERLGLWSERQRAFLQAVRIERYRPSDLVIRRPDPNGPECLLLYAMTLEDAQKMALAYYQYAWNQWQRGVSTQDVQEVAEKVAREKKRLSELDQLLGTSQKSFDDLVKTVPYRTESEAHEAIGELDRMLNTAQVEIAGIRARMDRILGYRKERPPGLQLSPEAVAKLDMMLVEEDIALQGAAARQEMATRLRTQANQFVDLKSTLASAAGERKTLVQSLDGHQKELETMQKNLESARRFEPKIPAKVVIYSVKWEDDPPVNN